MLEEDEEEFLTYYAPRGYPVPLMRLLWAEYHPTVAPTPKSGESREYAVTWTCTKKDPSLLVEALKRFLGSSMWIVEDIDFRFELTKRGYPHVHAYVAVTFPADKKRKCLTSDQLKRKNRGDLVDLRRLKTPVDVEGWRDYIRKDINDPEISEYYEENNLPETRSQLEVNYGGSTRDGDHRRAEEEDPQGAPHSRQASREAREAGENI